MSWRVEFRPEVEKDVAEAAAWYEARQPGLGAEFVEEIARVWDALAENPLLNARSIFLQNSSPGAVSPKANRAPWRTCRT
jgi:plasmid stabilization system protein ParE